ncbi:hypothetical protein BAUCODRAFT_569431 [Baudoinia panamericana UAMH 10762]|uniref:PH domain-containing protein n=1 Tax=Baudoinia panamericana (strain UAMH 10762) TaxID=717646 RepID=M2ML82_BAUPA|nr:uncharacterized protein BAUCODRAFT_569431 [Baudoinia panamericana UAMH 10762]EMC92133.1 hypothetical protein BAUCODRAFT_569431 [Baudoinia panamericana UAMH 10762]
MAGLEQIVVHARSYLVRWIRVEEHHSISWSVEPHKKSINFGIFKHPGTKGGLTPVLPTHETVDAATSFPPTPSLDGHAQAGKRPRQGSIGKSEDSTAVEKLRSIGLKEVAWAGKCEADKVSMGRYDVPEGDGGMFGLVFDNTFSKQTAKTIHFVLMTHPTNAPPKSGNSLHYSQVVSAGNAVGKNYSPSLNPITDSSSGMEFRGAEGTTFYTGRLNKRRRKKGQGYAKRFFSLDYTSSTLSYYRDRHSSALRGAVPLSLAAVGVNEKTREFSIDSGAEVWHLKAHNRKEFDGWRAALERAASETTVTPPPASSTLPQVRSLPKPAVYDPIAEREWQRIEEIVSKVSGTRDAVRGLAKDTDPKYHSTGLGLGLTTSRRSSNAPSPTSHDVDHSYFPDTNGTPDRRPFWKRKPSAERSAAPTGRRSISAQLAPAIGGAPAHVADDLVHERCMALLRDLDDAVSAFSALIAESKARRRPPLPTTASRNSFESTDNQEYFDALDGDGSPTQLFNIRHSQEDEGQNGHDTDADSDASSDTGDVDRQALAATLKTAHNGSFPRLPDTLPPLPLPLVKRRLNVHTPKHAPPSIISFLRKNAGKDLSTVSMPVTANEPTSLLQRLAESMEYSRLLDHAASASLPPTERLAYVTAFAVSYFANNRVKERALRKPFNPMLGETYELVREDLGFRFLAEKVSHHPVRMACQAESLTNGGWCFTQSPKPEQKFWGKSVELNTEGRARVVLQAPREQYSWSQATCFLRNVIAGEKYVEPVQSMTVHCETSGMRAVATFKSGGMFSGRSEDVQIELFDPAKGDAPLSLGLTGKWTEGLKRTDTGADVWTVGPLVPDAAKVYGFTTFAAALNEITAVEDGHLPPTDSRLRPDQRALEVGDVDKAEALKARLEERQRARRKVRETHGQEWRPRFFEKVSGGEGEGSKGTEEDLWILKRHGGYWEQRVKGEWTGVEEVFEV